MKKILFFFIFKFIFSLISFSSNILNCTEEEIHNIETSNVKYSYEFKLDWTKFDEISFKIPFTLAPKKIIPMFINVSLTNFINEGKFDYDFLNQINSSFKKGFEMFNVFGTDEFDVFGNLLNINIKSNDIKANKRNVDEQFIKNFYWLECGGNNVINIRKSGIIIVVNKGKFFKFSLFFYLLIIFLIL